MYIYIYIYIYKYIPMKKVTSFRAQVVLDFLEVILDAAEAAAQPAGLEEEEELRRARAATVS